jgi:type I restriction-modification system DNA methylase subunit
MRLYKDRALEDSLESLDISLVDSRWRKFQDFQSRKDDIKGFKEEKYQDGFLKDVFENCLGYQLDTTKLDNHNLRREEKNERGSKKADAVIVSKDKVIGVIELKDSKTKSLDQIEAQAFGYHNSHESSKYIITSNFSKLRFYIDKNTAFEEFDLFNLDREGFKKMHLIISYESISSNTPIELQGKTRKYEKDISVELYNEFSKIRLELFESIKNSNEIEDIKALSLSQKILDRAVFVLFAEDKGLINPKITDEIIEKWRGDWEKRNLYHFINLLFQAIDSGNDRMKIDSYNGGLFAPDEVIENLTVDDSILEKILGLSKYNFKSEVDVNVLGHIFENSLDDFQRIREDLLGEKFDIDKSIRKQDGIFYTPKYITEHIVNSTIGKMCKDKKIELGLDSENIDAEKYIEYQEFLQNLKILDPACGSGAFLNGAFDYLVREHKLVGDKLMKSGNILYQPHIDTQILENNLFGVDINGEAVTIAKLSLWLKTAKKGRQLTDLSNNIVVANSLTEMPFKEGSFDIVIGNPPYVRQELIKHYKKELEKRYSVFHGSADLYIYFLELGMNLLKEDGKLGYIFPNKWLKTTYAKPLRAYLKSYDVESIIDFGDIQVFNGATTYPLIMKLSKSRKLRSVQTQKITSSENVEKSLGKFTEKIDVSDLDENGWELSGVELLKKINRKAVTVENYTDGKIVRGVVTGFNEAFVIDGNTKDGLIREDRNSKELIKPLLRGRDIGKYSIDFADQYMIYPNSKTEIENYPAIYKHLLQFRERLEKRAGKQKWWELQSGGEKDFTKPKIVYMAMQTSGAFALDSGGHIINNSVFTYLEDDRFFLAYMNSKMGWYLTSKYCTQIQNGYQLIYDYFKQVPIPKISQNEQQPFIDLADRLIELNKQLQKSRKEFLDEVELEKTPKKIANFENLTLDQFITELLKAKKLKIKDRAERRNFKNEWKTLFEEDQKTVLELLSKISRIEKEIDQKSL